jgi:hypothetical protein
MADLKRKAQAWAIHSHSTEGHGFIGVGYWGWNIPTQCDGNRVALFRTRQAARDALPKVKPAFSRARVHRVTVEIEAEQSQ